MGSRLYAQSVYLDYVKEYSKELEPGKERILSAIDYFKKKTGIDIYVASAYGYNQKGIFEYAEDWPNNRENLKGFLIAINTLEDKNWEGNVKITYTADLNSKIAPERIEWVRKNCLLPLLDEKKVYINTEEGTEDAYYSGKAKYYMSIEATIKQLAFVVNPPPLEIVAIEYFGSKYKNADQLFVNNFHETIPLKAIEKFGRPFPSDKLTWEATEASGVNNTDKLISNKNGDEITFNSKSAPYHSNVVAKFGGKGVALNLFALGFKTEAVKDYVRHTVEEPIPFKLRHNLKSTSGYSIKETTSGPTNFTRTYSLSDTVIYWWPYDNNRTSFKPGVYTIKHELIGVSDLSLESSKNITILPSYNLNLVAVDSKNPKRFVGAGDTLYIVRNSDFEDRDISITASSSGGNNTFWPLDPNWSINSNHTNKDLDGQTNYVLKNIDNTKADFFKIGVSAFRGEEFVYVKRLSGDKQTLNLNILTASISKYFDGKTNKVKDFESIKSISDKVVKILNKIPGSNVTSDDKGEPVKNSQGKAKDGADGKLQYSFKMDLSKQWFVTEDFESYKYIDNRIDKISASFQVGGDFMLPSPYSFQFPIQKSIVYVGAYVGGGVKLDLIGQFEEKKKYNETRFSTTKQTYSMGVTGELKLGAKAGLSSGSREDGFIELSLKAYGKWGLKGKLEAVTTTSADVTEYKFKLGTDPLVAILEGECKVKSELFEINMFSFNYQYLLVDAYDLIDYEFGKD